METFKLNIIEASDSYKYSHAKQYPPDTQFVYSNFMARTPVPWGDEDEIMVSGIRQIIKNWLSGPVVTQESIDKMDAICKKHFGNDKIFNRKGWEYILNNYKGYLPLRIKTVPEGTVMGSRNVIMTVENTDPNCWWLTNFVESLLVQAWYPITVGSLSRQIKKLISRYLEETGTPEDVVVKLHDFGVRGASSMESAAIGGAAHLVNFIGTDNIPALRLLDYMYGEECAGVSIPAAEHSTITSWGKDNEVEAFRNMLEQFPDGLVAVVSDSYDLFNACENLWGDELKSQVLSRENGFLVVRPDSGNPSEVVLKTLEILGDKFGYSVNEKGFKVLDPHVRVIQGDGINYNSIEAILSTIKSAGWSADNIAFGMGGALLQQSNRDTLGFAFKASSIVRDGERFDFKKEPKTDMAKASLQGRLKLIRVEGSHGTAITTVPEEAEGDDLMQIVLENGVMFNGSDNLDDVRKRASI